MRKYISLALAVIMILASLTALTGCYKTDYALMIGVSTSQSGAKVSHTVAAIVIDKDYRIVSCRIDAIDISATLTEDGKVDAEPTYKSKAELGDDYGMLNPYYGSTLAEWYNQAQAFESYVVGKTRAEVSGIALNESGKPTDEVLAAGCTIAVTDFMKAVDNAFKNGHMVGLQTKDSFTLGVAICADVKMSGDDTASYTADFSATAIIDGKVAAAVIDSSEVTSKIKDGEFGKITNKGTKLEQGDDYNMVTYGKAIAEWYEQAQAFADSAVGVNVSELASLATEGVAGCTIYAGGYKQVLEKAASYAR